ncbi:hypothetical protein [Roseimaritima ulvae]|uniref:Uncharacterized protein n=1 Tax=Roseimaritima ulvae TaxID=980254 RepID=A0A5B9QSL4_9BACT|nr:hypothetical protein [Roseimaritima ulvae]QEG41984.1 hypothetical protein UC8_40130 [Roseimaritima ulvae]
MTADLHDPDKWKRFRSDGNPGGPDTASFDCICSVIIEFIYEGQLNLEIGPLVLLEDPHEYHNFTTPSVSES